MSFLSAAFLFALPLIAVPVAIHMYRRRQRDVILWGAMQFLASAMTKGRRFERLEELLLMALRLAAIAALVLALARPLVRSRWLGANTEREVILVLDNSLSMSRQLAGESACDRLKESVGSLIDSLSSGDGVQVLLAADSEWATAECIAADSAGQRRLREIVAGVEPTLGNADLLACLQAATHQEAAGELSSRRIIVFTDNQASSWQVDAAGAWQQLAADRNAAMFPMTIDVIDCGLAATRINNLAIVGLHTAQSAFRPGEQIELWAEIKNVGDVPSGNTQIEWLVDEKVIAESQLPAIEPRTQTEVRTNIRWEQAGAIEVACRIQATDDVPLDQEDSLVIEVADQLSILVVQPDAHGNTSPTAAELVAATLGFSRGQPQVWHSIFRPDAISPAALKSHSLVGYRAVVINDLAELDQATLNRLDSFVRAGGGLWLALGEITDRAAFNRDWYGDGDGLSPLAIDSLVLADQQDDAAAMVHPPTRDHPATSQLANTTQLDIDEARIRQHWKFANRSTDEEAVSTLLESGTGQPLVVEKYVGQGRVLVQAFPLGLEWSNLPLLKAYVVLVQDWLNYLAAPTMARFNLSPGAAILVNPPPDAAPSSAQLITPRGKAIPLITAEVDSADPLRFTQTRLPGMYHARFNGADQAVTDVPFHVARDAAESNLSFLSEAERGQLLAAGVSFDGVHPESGAATARAPRQTPFWGTLLAGLVVLLVAELLISNGLARLRHGFAVSTG